MHMHTINLDVFAIIAFLVICGNRILEKGVKISLVIRHNTCIFDYASQDYRISITRYKIKIFEYIRITQFTSTDIENSSEGYRICIRR